MAKHQHSYKQTGMTLWCKCGLTKDIVCAHDWSLERTENTTIDKVGGVLNQTRQMRICKKCGAIANSNVTTGETTIRH